MKMADAPKVRESTEAPKAAGNRGKGRVKGVPNKATAAIKDLAQKYTGAAMIELARLATGAESEAARVAAIKELFDRGYGKATQAVDLTADIAFRKIERTIVRPEHTDR